MKILNFSIKTILDILFPIKCFRCGNTGSAICNKCLSYIKPAERETEENIIACFDYREKIIKDIIWSMKYNKYSALGFCMGEILYNEMQEHIEELISYNGGSKIYIIPIPSSKNRKKYRGYNQTEYIAKGFVKNNNNFVIDTNIVIKTKDTIPQARIKNRKKRLDNIKNSFSVLNKDLVKDKIFIIIDDVTTTGATMIEVIKILNKAGAKKVIGFAVAH